MPSPSDKPPTQPPAYQLRSLKKVTPIQNPYKKQKVPPTSNESVSKHSNASQSPSASSGKRPAPPMGCTFHTENERLEYINNFGNDKPPKASPNPKIRPTCCDSPPRWPLSYADQIQPPNKHVKVEKNIDESFQFSIKDPPSQQQPIPSQISVQRLTSTAFAAIRATALLRNAIRDKSVSSDENHHTEDNNNDASNSESDDNDAISSNEKDSSKKGQKHKSSEGSHNSDDDGSSRSHNSGNNHDNNDNGHGHGTGSNRSAGGNKNDNNDNDSNGRNDGNRNPEPENHNEDNDDYIEDDNGKCYRLCSLEQIQSPAHDLNSDNTAALVFLAAGHHPPAHSKFTTYGTKTTTSTTMGKYYGKTNKDASYDRMWTWGDLKSSLGLCLCNLSQTPAESAMLMSKFNQKNCSIGDAALIIEPQATGKCLSPNGDLPIIQTKEPIVPIDPQCNLSFPIKEPNASFTRYFIIHNRNLLMQGISIVHGSCSGGLCDRQQIPIKDSRCICNVAGRNTSAVLEAKIHISKPHNDMPDFRVLNFCSLRITKLFIAQLGLTTQADDYKPYQDEIRTAAHNIIELVNKNGGWTVLGWYKKGLRQDPSSSSTDKTDLISSLDVAPHVSLLEPTNYTNRLKKKIKRLQFHIPETQIHIHRNNRDT